jgi:hypothetical protein
MGKKNVITCCFFENRVCNENCMAHDTFEEEFEDGSISIIDKCLRLRAQEFSAYTIQEGIDHLAMAIMGGPGECECEDCQKKRQEVEEKAKTNLYS